MVPLVQAALTTTIAIAQMSTWEEIVRKKSRLPASLVHAKMEVNA